MTEDKPIAKPIIDDATREKMALMFSGEVYLPDDVDGFFDLQAAQRDLQLELNATPLTNPKRRTELMQAFFGAAGEGLYLECPVYANWGCNTYWGERCYANFNLTLVDDGEIFIGSHTMIGPNVTLVATGHPVRPDLRYQGAQYSLPVHIGENVWIGANVTVLPGVTIGDNAVIGANSLVTKAIPASYRSEHALMRRQLAGHQGHPRQHGRLWQPVQGNSRNQRTRRRLLLARPPIQ